MVTGYQQYARTRIETAGPEQLLIMLYDGALRFLRAAEAAVNAQPPSFEEYERQIERARDILNELMNTTNFEAGEIAQNLWRIYEYCSFRLVQAALRRDAAAIGEVRGIIAEIREAFVQAALIVRKQAGAPDPVSEPRIPMAVGQGLNTVG